jgi:predicted Fe-S protein YdhL (DUF1289 family)
VTENNFSTLPGPRPASPCINICTLDDRGYCRGCYRTIQEITVWSRLTAGEQLAVLAKLPARSVERGATADRIKHD